MPDEDSNVTGISQTNSAQSWDDNDFVLDFWDDENETETTNSEDDIKNLDVTVEENKSEDLEGDTIQFDDKELFWDEEKSDDNDDEEIELWNLNIGTWEDNDYGFWVDNKTNEENLEITDKIEDNGETQVEQEEKSEEVNWEENKVIEDDVETEDFSIKSEDETKQENQETLSFDWDKVEDNGETQVESVDKPEEVNWEENKVIEDEVELWENTQQENISFLLTNEETQDFKVEPSEEINLINNSNDIPEDKNNIFIESKSNQTEDSDNSTEKSDNDYNAHSDLINSSENNFNQEINLSNAKNDTEINEPTEILDMQNIETQVNTEKPGDETFWTMPENKGEKELNSDDVENSQNEGLIENTNNFTLDESNVNQNTISSQDNLINWESSQNNVTTENENIENFQEQNQLQETPSADYQNVEQTNTQQPNMVDLLWWTAVNFSEEESQTDSQNFWENQEDHQFQYDNKNDGDSSLMQNNPELYTNNEGINLQNALMTEENTQPNNLYNEESLNAIDSTLRDPENGDAQNMVQNIQEQWNVSNEITQQSIPDNAPQFTENVPMQTWLPPIKSTLSLDEILDSELTSNPEFSDSSRAVPKNIPVKSGRHKKTVFTFILVLILAWLFVTLAFPSITNERKEWDVIVDTPTIIEEENQRELESPVDMENEWWDSEEQDTENTQTSIWNHNAPTIELFPEDTVDDEDTTSDNKDSYLQEETSSQKSETLPDENKTENSSESSEESEGEEIKEEISIEDIESKILTFKSEGEKYKQLGEENSNEKVVKYAAYIIRLCNDYETNIDNEERINSERFSAFETKVNEFISRIEENLWETSEA